MAEGELAERAAQGEVAAFAELVRAHQAMAFGYALALLRDFHLAQDATQEAFVAAYFGLPGLRDRTKFTAWLRGIVRHQCRRFLRRRTEAALGVDTERTLVAPGPSPEEWAADREAADRLLAEIAALPQALRAVTVLFYLEGLSQREVAAFLSLPITTVNNRLHAARRRLNERRLTAMAKTFKGQGLADDFASTVVEVIRRRGPVLDLRFPDASPAVLSTITIDGPAEGGLLAGVMQQLPDGTARVLMLTPPTHTAPGTGARRPLAVRAAARQFDHGALPETIRLMIAGIERDAPRDRVRETGLKALDLLCPLPQSGAVGIFGDAGVGKAVLIGELLHNLDTAPSKPTLFAFIERGEEASFMHRTLPQVPATDPMRQALYVAVDQRATLDAPELADAFEAIVYLSREVMGLHIFPAVDPLRSSSRLLTPTIVGEEHYQVAQQVRELLARYSATDEVAGIVQATPEDRQAWRARQVRRFLGQPMFVAADFTSLPGQAVPLAETIRGCAAILRGDCDDFPLEAFWMVGALDEVIAKAGRLRGERRAAG